MTDLAHHPAQATETRADVRLVRAPYAHFRRNEVLDALFARHLEPHGIVMTEPESGVYLGSSDIGNVSAVAPAIHPFVAITGTDQSDHTAEFAAAATCPTARSITLSATQALAHTTIDILADPESSTPHGRDSTEKGPLEYPERRSANAESVGWRSYCTVLTGGLTSKSSHGACTARRRLCWCVEGVEP